MLYVSPPRSPRKSKQGESTPKYYSVTDGTAAVGTIQVMPGGAFTSITTTGEIIGEFATLREAMVAFDGGGL